MNRRELLQTAAAGLGVGLFGPPAAALAANWTLAQQPKRKKLLVFTKSAGFEHSVIKRSAPNQLSHAERILTTLGEWHGFDVHCTKDGRIFIPEELEKFDAFFFYTTGDLTREGNDKNPPMPPDGKANLLAAVERGKGFVGSHCASDTFHSGKDGIDPYIAMLGGEFITHGAQQKAVMRVVGGKFPNLRYFKDFDLHEEWYALKNFPNDLHVILAQDSTGMKGAEYQRPLYPATWARMQGKGRVFYTSMGHREDVWTNGVFQTILTGGILWALGMVDADVQPNIENVTPKANELPKS